MNKGIILFEIRQQDIPRIVELTKKYSDRPMDFADATLIIAAEKTGIKTIMSIDKDFEIYRLPGKVKMKNIFSS
jgi:predicted nucleic acid-binding protein